MEMSLLFYIFCFSSLVIAQDNKIPEGDYLGQPVPGKIPEVFAPGLISTGLNEFNAVFSPDGKEFYFSVRSGWDLFVVYVMKRDNDKWKGPEIASFSGRYSDADPFITTDGKKLFFCSNRPIEENDKTSDWNLWMCKKSGNSWDTPELLPFCSSKNEFYPTVSGKGNVYFHADYEGQTSFDLNRTDIYMSEFSDGNYQTPVKLSTSINSEAPEWDPFISPDEDYIIFTSPRPGGYGSGDMYISFRKDGEWSKAINMGDKVNSSMQDYCPGLSPDRKYFFFSSYKALLDLSVPSAYEYSSISKELLSYKNGSGNIFWVSAEVIDDLRPD
jgi:Tol biopolymer transport system component